MVRSHIGVFYFKAIASRAHSAPQSSQSTTIISVNSSGALSVFCCFNQSTLMRLHAKESVGVILLLLQFYVVNSVFRKSSTTMPFASSTTLPPAEYYALYDLYTSTYGFNWVWKEPYTEFGYPWNFDISPAGETENPCSSTLPWQGVVCKGTCEDTSGCEVEQIILDKHNLTGTLPESLVNLTQLSYLVMSHNSLVGTIPAIIGQLQLMVDLDFGTNHLEGTLPPSLGNLTNLEYLYLYNNSLTGTIPNELSNLNKVLYFYLSFNKLTGTIPPSLGNLENIMEMYLDSNILTGTIPPSLDTMAATIKVLYMQENLLTGTLPASLGHLTELKILALFSNRLTGTLPPSIGLLPHLEELYIYNNNLTGTIPSTLTNSSSVRYALLSQNKLTGTIPSSPTAWNPKSKMLYFTISNNFISGEIPPTMCTTMSTLGQNVTFRALEAFNNLLWGTIPSEIGNWTVLNYLEIDSNELTGSLPDTMGAMIHMRSLQLQSNQLTGSIPSSFNAMEIMFLMYLSDNYFTGNIYPITSPPSLALQQLYLYNNFFSGSFCLPSSSPLSLPPMTISPDNSSNTMPDPPPTSEEKGFWRLEVLDLSSNIFTGTIDGDLFINSTYLSIVSLNNNAFSGSIPFSMFADKYALRSVVLSLNCFSGTLPISICGFSNGTVNSGSILSQLILDGLHSDSSCTTKAIPFITESGIVIANSAHGTIPSCLLQLPQLNTLHLGGNSFSGSIPNVPLSTSLTELVVSSNDLTGSIPHHIWDSNLIVLDLSLNRLQGTLPSDMLPTVSVLIDGYSDITNVTVNLQVNQLSGRVPSVLWNLPSNDVNMLEGNLFSCNADRSDIPKNDPKYDSYNCGSNSTNYSLIAFGCILVVVCFLIVCFTSLRSNIFTCMSAYRKACSLDMVLNHRVE